MSSLTIPLWEPGLSPVLRAGLGGLAASIQALARAGTTLPGDAHVHADRVVLDWSRSSGPAFFHALFEASFAVRDGLIDLPGMWKSIDRPGIEVRVAVQDALRQTFLQHGKSASKDGAPTARTVEIDEQPRTLQVQRYRGFVHREQGDAIGTAAASATVVDLAAWANPGAVQRHVAHGSTRMEYRASEALCACYALVGCVSLRAPGGGVVVVPEPTDLVEFAKLRHLLTPSSVQKATVGGVGDAVLAAEIALRLASVGRTPAVGRVTAQLLRTTAWVQGGQKTRVETLGAAALDPGDVDAYRRLADLMPARVVSTAGTKAQPADTFAVPSSFRAFAAENLARGRRWYLGFADARDLRDRQRRLHQVRSKDKDNRGGLWPDELKGVRAMSEHLDEAERLLVLSVQRALSHRLGAIAAENADNKRARENRWDRERERWRLAFAGARTLEQLRYALADLWSRGGQVAELRESGWGLVLPLVRADWQAARDLALVALAAYEGRPADATASDRSATEPSSH